ncbi:hypothetical protein CPB86DRAFT_802050 [Serendipita vermifera]|nr:hypothetical protein CPB86DRAFT_802050 [Serendipita vermifera]
MDPHIVCRSNRRLNIKRHRRRLPSRGRVSIRFAGTTSCSLVAHELHTLEMENQTLRCKITQCDQDTEDLRLCLGNQERELKEERSSKDAVIAILLNDLQEQYKEVVARRQQIDQIGRKALFYKQWIMLNVQFATTLWRNHEHHLVVTRFVINAFDLQSVLCATATGLYHRSVAQALQALNLDTANGFGQFIMDIDQEDTPSFSAVE